MGYRRHDNGRRRLRDLSDTERIVPALPLDRVGRLTVQRLELSAAEFLGYDGAERIKKCRQFAAEAKKAAACAINSGTEKTSLDLARQWNNLADEIEKIEEGTTANG